MIKDALKQAQDEGTAHSEFWKFVAYSSATVVIVKQGMDGPANWPVVVLVASYLAIVGGSSVAIKIVGMLRGNRNVINNS